MNLHKLPKIKIRYVCGQCVYISMMQLDSNKQFVLLNNKNPDKMIGGTPVGEELLRDKYIYIF